jgi:protein-disulfide isomerase
MSTVTGLRSTALAVALAVTASLVVPIATATETRPLFRLDGFDYAESDLDADYRQQIYEAYARYSEVVDRVVTAAAMDLVVAEEASKTGKSPEAVRAQMLPPKAIEDAQIKRFYDQNRKRIPAPLAEVRGQIVEFLTREQTRLRTGLLIEELRAEGRIAKLLPAAAAPSVKIDTAGLPTKGPAGAPVTIVEFADFQCPHCKAAHPQVAAVIKQFAPNVRMVFMHLPLNRSGISRKVAIGSTCAAEQDKFWLYHDLAFDRQAELTAASPRQLAASAEMDMAKFDACYQSPAATAMVDKSESEAQRLGIASTPTIFVNGQRLKLTHSVGEDLERAVADALKGS